MTKGTTPSIKDIRRLVFDYDTFIYRCGFAAEKKRYAVEGPGGLHWFDNKKDCDKFRKTTDENIGDEVFVEHTVEPVENALSNFKNAVNGVLEKFNNVAYTGYLSDGPGFRAAVATTRVYKGNRDPTHKPAHYDELREYGQRRFGAKVVRQIEADDACGIELGRAPTEVCVVSNDKDLRQISGWHYNWTKSEEPPTWVRPKDAILKFYEQLIAGDPTDNVVGIPGVGPVGALETLDGATSPADCEQRAWERYKKDYPRPDGDEGLQFVRDRFLENARLVYILRRQEEIGKLWEPGIELT